ncbi:MAG: hypothetical protein KGD68_00940 [Candidatus Lokiarchaeota archaeon]|nr:hypothetical protein [Candidatus Lokiarchaeota archaeon]
MSKDNKEYNKENDKMKDDLEDELENQLEMQDQIHKACKMKGNSEDKQKKWKEKYG